MLLNPKELSLRKWTSQKIVNRIMFRLERFLIRGPQFQLIVIGVAIAFISGLGGYLLFQIEGVALPESIWWAFLRLTDPGYLGDDNGVGRRVLSTVLTILGYVVFLGALVAIMTQWLTQTMKRLESGMTPISMRGHITILGYVDATPTIVRELFASKGRLGRFLSRMKVKSPTVAILSQEVGYHLTSDLRAHLGRFWNPGKIIFRTGNPLKEDEIERVNPECASVVIIPAVSGSFEETQFSDMRAIKSLLSIQSRALQGGELRTKVVVEILDPEKLLLAERLGGKQAEVICSRSLLARLFAHNIFHPGISSIFQELLSHSVGSEIYIRDFPELAGRRWYEIQSAFENAIVIGAFDKTTAVVEICPEEDFELRDCHQLVMIAESYEDVIVASDKFAPTKPESKALERKPGRFSKKILILGWNLKVPELLRELADYSTSKVEVTVVSTQSLELRRSVLLNQDYNWSNITLHQFEADYTRTQYIQSLEVDGFDTVLMVATEQVQDVADADARTLMGYLQLHQQEKIKDIKNFLVELVDPETESWVPKGQGRVILSSHVVSHVLASVALRPELNKVLHSFFGPTGAEFVFLALPETTRSETVSFRELCDFGWSLQVQVIGVDCNGTLLLNPSKSQTFPVDSVGRIVAVRKSLAEESKPSD